MYQGLDVGDMFREHAGEGGEMRYVAFERALVEPGSLVAQ